MGEYSNLTNEERGVILELADVGAARGVTTWLLSTSKTSSCLLPLDGKGRENIADVPKSESFYLGLREKGFVALTHGSPGSVQICVQQPALDYLKYASKTSFGRWREDRSYDLIHEKTVWGKFAWLLLAYLLGFGSAILSAIVLTRLGWISIGG